MLLFVSNCICIQLTCCKPSHISNVPALILVLFHQFIYYLLIINHLILLLFSIFNFIHFFGGGGEGGSEDI